MGDCAEFVDQWLKNKDHSYTRKRGLCLYAFFLLLDIASVVLLREAPTVIVQPGDNVTGANHTHTYEDYVVYWEWSDLVDNLGDFTDDTVDVILLLLVRVVLTMLCATLAVRLGKPKLHDLVKSDVASDTRTQPLLINQGEGQLHQLSTDADKSHLESHLRKKRAEIKKNIAVALIFILSTAAQVFLGVKVISFHGHWTDDNEYASYIKTMQAREDTRLSNAPPSFGLFARASPLTAARGLRRACSSSRVWSSSTPRPSSPTASSTHSSLTRASSCRR